MAKIRIPRLVLLVGIWWLGLSFSPNNIITPFFCVSSFSTEALPSLKQKSQQSCRETIKSAPVEHLTVSSTPAPDDDFPSSSLSKSPIHTLILCRHGDSIWNGGEPGTHETFTGWTDVPLSQKGIKEAQNTGKLVSKYELGIDVCCTSILQRAQLTSHYICWAFQDKPSHVSPRKYIQDYRLNERHYGALQGYVKADVEKGLHADLFDPSKVRAWRRSWYEIPPSILSDSKTGEYRRQVELKKYSTICGGDENVPVGESLQQVASNRIRPFLNEVLCPILNESASSKTAKTTTIQSTTNGEVDEESNDTPITGGTALIVAHANSLRALIGVLCELDRNNNSSNDCDEEEEESTTSSSSSSSSSALLRRLEALRLPTGVPLVMKFRHVAKRKHKEVNGSQSDVSSTNHGDGDAHDYYFQVNDLEGLPIDDLPSRDQLPVFPLSYCI